MAPRLRQDEKSDILPLPLMVRAPLRESDQLRPPSMLPLPKASDSAAPGDGCGCRPSPGVSAFVLRFSAGALTASGLCSSIPAAELQMCSRKSILSRAMPQPSPPIVVHLSGVPSKLALSITVPVNAASPMCSKVSGRTNSSILPQFSNAAAPMLFMPSGQSRQAECRTF